MKKLLLILFFIIIFLIILNSNIITNNILLSFNICFNSLFPSLIPFMLISNIIIKYDFVYELSNSFKFITDKLKINKNCSFAIIMSMISGSPSNSKYLKDLYDNKLININDVNKCIKFCHFMNPLFIINTIGIAFFNDKKVGLIILISHFFSSFILGIFFKEKNNNYNIKYNFKTKKNNFLFILNESIINTASNLLLILGVITFCLIITGILDSLFNINKDIKFIYGLIEVTQGLKYLSASNLNIYMKTIISSFMISFGGFCIHLQVFSILDNKKIRYIPYLISRLFHGILASLITTIIILFF